AQPSRRREAAERGERVRGPRDPGRRGRGARTRLPHRELPRRGARPRGVRQRGGRNLEGRAALKLVYFLAPSTGMRADLPGLWEKNTHSEALSHPETCL